jgi:hypothetical protein
VITKQKGRTMETRKIVTLSRRFSGFVNVADTWRIGDDPDHAGSTHDYILPDGYTLNEMTICGIADPNGIDCAIVTHSSGRPQFVSVGAGGVDAHPVLRRADEPNAPS